MKKFLITLIVVLVGVGIAIGVLAIFDEGGITGVINNIFNWAAQSLGLTGTNVIG